jgi:lysozyme
MRLSSAGLELLKKSEGFRHHAYMDIAGFRTIGFGHRLATDEAYPSGITLAQGEAILSADLAIAESAIDRLVKVPLAQGQFDALVDFVFNLGAGRLASSTLLTCLNAGRYDEAAWHLLAWDHAGSREVVSLKTRREAEFKLWSPHLSVQASAARARQQGKPFHANNVQVSHSLEFGCGGITPLM